MQHELDHFAWEDKLYEFLTDPQTTELTLPLDEHKCQFGKWIYGPERQRMEQQIPELIPMLAALEEPHLKLHQSAQRIKATFHRADHDLPTFLLEQTFDHLQWLIALGNAIMPIRAVVAQ